jgi:hypothetical protein
MTDEYVVFYMYAFADKSMTGYLAAFTDRRALLYFDKSSYPAIISYPATVGIDEVEYFDVLSDFHIVQALLIIIDGDLLHDGS